MHSTLLVSRRHVSVIDVYQVAWPAIEILESNYIITVTDRPVHKDKIEEHFKAARRMSAGLYILPVVNFFVSGPLISKTVQRRPVKSISMVGS